jgi:hypothetical protein
VAESVTPLGWHVIAGEALLDALREAEAGEPADMVYAQLYTASEHDSVTPERWLVEVTLLGFSFTLSRGG